MCVQFLLLLLFQGLNDAYISCCSRIVRDIFCVTVLLYCGGLELLARSGPSRVPDDHASCDSVVNRFH